MESKTKTPFRYIAGGCFAASAIIYLINNCLRHHIFNFYYISLILAFAAIAVGLFLSVPMVSAAGSVLFLISRVVILFRNVKYFITNPDFFNYSSFFLTGAFALFALFALLLLISCLNRCSAKITGIIAAVFRFIPAIYIFSFGRSLWDIVLLLLECAGAVFLGFAFSGLKDKPKVLAAAAPQASGVTDTYEKLTHLKELLDKGVITQEEFDAKKKDILGS